VLLSNRWVQSGAVDVHATHAAVPTVLLVPSCFTWMHRLALLADDTFTDEHREGVRRYLLGLYVCQHRLRVSQHPVTAWLLLLVVCVGVVVCGWCSQLPGRLHGGVR